MPHLQVCKIVKDIFTRLHSRYYKLQIDYKLHKLRYLLNIDENISKTTYKHDWISDTIIDTWSYLVEKRRQDMTKECRSMT